MAKLSYYERNKEKCKARQAAYYRAHSEELGKKQKARRSGNAAYKKYWRKYYKTYQRGYRLQKKYGVSLEQYRELVGRQKGRCKICKRRPRTKPLYVDHDHKTGKFRGLLCHTCNSGLGYFKDRKDWVQAAARYLS